ncbi:probable serine/threonine-protein kinase PBL3 [Syzygium oleosum]|uniref:probable serine/threonine-protein kinase PBL3 n=1 Tax=Syzygium oleosum TaxID=219896 RepID=UPI0024BB3758|nr:probable serine/threonine-protein kinase PBL3 [Syzygium oleosum]
MNKKDELFHPYRLHCFCYDVLKDATNKFSGTNFIGEGGFGDVYKGWVSYRTMNAAKPHNGQAIAVKRLQDKGPQGQDEWLNELRFLSKLNHPNIVKLIGYCGNNEHRIVVYEFMAKGSLEDQLLRGKDQDLSWRTRIKIAIGAARGLDHLHTQSKPVIHRDVKTSNVLLTSHFDAKISDFGLAKYGPQGDQSHVSSRVLGTRGYFAPEYIATGHLTLKTDVYSFGVVLLEIFSGSRAIRKPSNGTTGNLAQWAEPYLKDKVKLHRVMDRKLKRNFPAQEAHEFAEIILKCLHLDPKSRPTMAEVVARLEEIRSVSKLATITSQTPASLRNLEGASNSKDMFRKPKKKKKQQQLGIGSNVM